jgi:hypothetical protein
VDERVPLLVETSTRQHTTLARDTFTLLVEFEHTIAAGAQSQGNALDGTATVIGFDASY